MRYLPFYALLLFGCAYPVAGPLPDDAPEDPSLVCLGAGTMTAETVCEAAKTARCTRMNECAGGSVDPLTPGALDACKYDITNAGFLCPLGKGQLACKYAAGDCIEAIRHQPCGVDELPFLCEASSP